MARNPRELSPLQLDMLRKVAQSRVFRPENQQDEPSILSGGEGTYTRAGTGVAKTILNVLDQPKSTITTGIRYGLDEDQETNVVEGMIKGLLGKKHTSTADILRDQGVTNPWVLGVGGLVGDVALDPLTYVGVNRVKGLTAGEAQLRGTAKAVAETVEARLPEVPAGRAAQLARQIAEENPYKLQLRVGLPGKKKVIYEKVDNSAVGRIHDTVKGLEGQPRLLAEMFSTSAAQPYGMDQLVRAIEAEMSGRFNDLYMGHRRIFNAVSPEDREKAFRYYNNPEGYADLADHTLTNTQRLGIRKKQGINLADENIRTISDLVGWVKRSNMKMKRAEFEQGLHRDLIPPALVRKRTPAGMRYVEEPRDWDELDRIEQETLLDETETQLRTVLENPEALRRMPGLARSRTAGSGMVDVSTVPHEGLELAGARPIADIGEATLDRLASTFRRQSRASALEDAIERFGLDGTTVEGKRVVQDVINKQTGGMKWRPVGEALNGDIAKLKKYKNRVLPEPIIKMLNEMEGVVKDPTIGNRFLAFYDKAMGHIKAAQTILQPGYFTRTSMGDLLQNFAAGVRNPMRYYDSRMILNEIRKNQAKDLIATVRDPDAPLETLTRARPDSRSVHQVNIGGELFDSGKLYEMFIRHGSMSGEIITERLRGYENRMAAQAGDDIRDKALRAKTKGFGALNDLEAWAADKNISRETTFRMAHYMDRLDKEITARLQKQAERLHMGKGDLAAIRERLGPEDVAKLEDEAGQYAASQVRKFNIDYGALTKFEKTAMRRVMPFYSWFRRNLPLQVSMLASKPGFMTLYGKGTEAIQNILGTGDPENDWMLPQWIRESFPVRWAQANVEGNLLNKITRVLAGASGTEAVFMPLLTGVTPFGDLETALNPIQRGVETGSVMEGVKEAAQSGFNMTGPLIKAPAELSLGRSVFTGQEIGDWRGYFAQQAGGFPRASYAATGIGDAAVAPALMSFLAGPRFEKVSQQRQKGEFQRRRDIYDKRIAEQRDVIGRQRNIHQYKEVFTPDQWKKMTMTSDLYKLGQYLTWAGRSTGSYPYP